MIRVQAPMLITLLLQHLCTVLVSFCCLKVIGNGKDYLVLHYLPILPSLTLLALIGSNYIGLISCKRAQRSNTILFCQFDLLGQHRKQIQIRNMYRTTATSVSSFGCVILNSRLTLFPLGRDNFFHHDSISRDKAWGKKVKGTSLYYVRTQGWVGAPENGNFP